jgi:predicted ATPase
MASASSIESDEAVDELAKPPFLRRVRIRGYKSIAFCDVTLEPLTILVGRNASGKSNFLDALAFLRDSIESGVAEALKRRGGIRNIVCRSVQTDSVDLELETSLVTGSVTGRAEKEYQFNYRVRVHAIDEADFDGPYEQLTITDPESGAEFGFRSQPNHVDLLGPDGRNTGTAHKLSQDLFLRLDVRDPDWDFAHALRYMGFYNFRPEAMRQLRRPSNEWLLERDGSNIASALSSLMVHDPSSFIRVQSFLSAVTRSVELKEVARYGSYETVRFRVLCPDPSHAIEFDADSMSDGTLRALAALTAVYQRVGSYGSPSLVAIEEPEAGLHPAAMRALVAAMDEATLRTQVLLTTHSPDLLDAEEVKPENVRVVQMIDGQTIIGPVDEANVEVVGRKLNTLGGLERDDRLEPDLDDRDRQQLLQQAREGSPV